MVFIVSPHVQDRFSVLKLCAPASPMSDVFYVSGSEPCMEITEVNDT
jgi:hypothetical protein